MNRFSARWAEVSVSSVSLQPASSAAGQVASRRCRCWRLLADQGQQRRQLGIEVDPVLADRHGLLARQAGRFGGQSVGGLAVLTAVDVADDQSDRLAGPRVEGAVVTDDLLQPT